jgi:hypothetical protein
MGESAMANDQRIARLKTDAGPVSGAAEPLEEIARRLVAIHVALAERLDGGRDLQTWTRHQIEDLMAYVDDAIDAEAEMKGGTH